jgi:hypothetical protein
MRLPVFCLFFLLMNVFRLEAHMMHRSAYTREWTQENLPPFDELIVSWNAARPAKGNYHIYVSAKVDQWSEWLPYATWGQDGQSSFSQPSSDGTMRVYQDVLGILGGKKATGFRIKIEMEGRICPCQFYGTHVYTNSDAALEIKQGVSFGDPVYVPVAGLSQMMLNHPRCRDLCSPTSTIAVVRYLTKNGSIDPVRFALDSWDRGFDIFGNWVLNVAEASATLGSSWQAWVERLSGFDAIYRMLAQKTPVVVSVRGPLSGSALPYEKGHLMAVIGYDPVQQKVICMDPAFPIDQQTQVQYDLSDFVQAWNRRGRIAYVFSPRA